MREHDHVYGGKDFENKWVLRSVRNWSRESANVLQASLEEAGWRMNGGKELKHCFRICYCISIYSGTIVISTSGFSSPHFVLKNDQDLRRKSTGGTSKSYFYLRYKVGYFYFRFWSAIMNFARLL